MHKTVHHFLLRAIGGALLRLLDDRMRKVVMPDLRLQLVAADVGVVGVLPCRAQGLDFGKCRSGRSGPAVSRGKMKNSHEQ